MNPTPAMVPLRLCIIIAALSLHQTVTAFSPRTILRVNNNNLRVGIGHLRRSCCLVHSSPNDDWGLGDVEEEEDPRLTAMRSMLESSWDNSSMGTVPTNPQKAAEAASQSIADAMRDNKNVLMIDLRLPSYDITEGSAMYDRLATYEFCSYLSDNLRSRDLIRKSLILVRNEVERAEIDRLVSQRDDNDVDTQENDTEDRIGDDNDSWDDAVGVTSFGRNDDVDEFRKQLMSSWETTSSDENEGDKSKNNSSPMTPPASPSQKKSVTVNSNSLSHRLGSMVGNNPDIINNNGGPDMFDKVIAAVDENAKLSSDEDALIILAPYDTSDIICLRRIMARYGQTRTIIIVNSRIETLPRELDPAVLVYGILPLIARSKSGGNDDNESVGLKAVVMKRYPSNWNVYVDVYGDGFVEALAPYQQQVISDKQFPSPEWIAQRVQAHVEDLSKRKNE